MESLQEKRHFLLMVGKQQVESSNALALAVSTNNENNTNDLLLSKAGCTSTSTLAFFCEREDTLFVCNVCM
jgi:hypothetical protein